jgi:putative membrane protein
MAKRAQLLGLAVAMAAAGSALAQNEWRDREFLEAAIQENNLEMKLGQLAEQRGTTPDIRAYGRDLAGGHFPDRLEANRTAARLHMLVPLRGPGDSREQRARLSALIGRDFDRAFVRFVAERQAEDLTAFRREAAGSDGIAGLARRALPTLQMQLETARRLDRTMNHRPVSDQ